MAPTSFAPLAELPHAARQPLPFVGWIIDILPISRPLYDTANALSIVACFLATFGLFARPAMIAMIPLSCYLYGVPQCFGKLSHYQFLFWATTFLAFAPCTEVWSFDAILRRLRGIRADRRPHFRFALAIRWLMLTLGSVYFFSGFRKLYEAGLFWSLSDNPVNLLRTEWLEQFQAVPAIRVDHWPILCSIAASGVILFELSYPFLLLGKRTRLSLMVDAILFHNLNGYFLNIDFVYLKTAHLPYLDWGKIRTWLLRQKRWLAWLLVIVAAAVLSQFVWVTTVFPFLLVGAAIDLIWNRSSALRRGRWCMKWRRWLPSPKPVYQRLAHQTRLYKLSFVTGIIFIGLNTACGALGIHSWPFSSYPTYSFVRSATMEYGWFLPKTAQGKILDLDQEAIKADFRKENILPMAERIVDAWKWNPQDLPPKILNCWLRWRTELPALNAATQCEVVIRTYPIEPERYGELIQETPLGHLEIAGGEWIFVPCVNDTVPATQ